MIKSKMITYIAYKVISCFSAIKHLSEIPYRFYPLEKKIVFDNFRGRGFGDDPKYISLELLKFKIPGLKMIWLTNDMNIDLPNGITPVKYGSRQALFELCTAKVWIDNVKNSIRPMKRKGQFYIQTWHSTLGLKVIEQLAGNLPLRYVYDSKNDSRLIDLMYSNSTFRINYYKKYFWYSGEVVKSDVPRLAPLFDDSTNLKNRILSLYNIPENVMIVLYAPTFRKYANADVYKLDFEKIINSFKSRYRKEVRILVRLHPSLNIPIEFDNSLGLVQVSKYPDMQELLAASDVLLTDFSASMFEMAIAKKIVFLIAKDKELYLNSDRKLLFSLSELPFTMNSSEDELDYQISSFNLQNYILKCKLFFDKIGMEDNGNGSRNIAEIVKRNIDVL